MSAKKEYVETKTELQNLYKETKTPEYEKFTLLNQRIEKLERNLQVLSVGVRMEIKKDFIQSHNLENAFYFDGSVKFEFSHIELMNDNDFKIQSIVFRAESDGYEAARTKHFSPENLPRLQ